MSVLRLSAIVTATFASISSPLYAAEFVPMVGVDPLLNPDTTRLVFPIPGPGFPGELSDGDRLAGTSIPGDPAEYTGNGEPMFPPNAFGSLSFTFRRGSVPIPPNNRLPILGIDFLGGPRLDLDGDLNNGGRSLVPVAGAEAVVIPDSHSVVELTADFAAGTVTLDWMDVNGTNVGGVGIGPLIATTINVLAGTGSDATPGPAINPSVDTRQGTLTAFTGITGSLPGVYRIEGLGYEIWQDSIDPGSSSAGVLGTLQLLGSLRGWLVVRDPFTGSFPTLTGAGLGTTLWPTVATEYVGQVVVTANGLQGGSATITVGATGDDFSACTMKPPGNCNGGLALADDDGDLGAYFDQVVVPNLDPSEHSFVYLESAGFGVNNSFDPVFGDTVGWDVVIIAASSCGVVPESVAGDLNGDLHIDLADYALFDGCFSGAGVAFAPGCEPGDFDVDGDIDLIDFGAFQDAFGLTVDAADCRLDGR